jgi:hypothetical protein
MRNLRLLNLCYNKTDNDNVDNTKLNKTFLTVDNGIFHIFGPESMMDGSDWKVNADIQFNKQAIISFFDEDLLRNLSTTKHFRNHIVEENEIHDVPKKIKFATNNANYILTYQII